MEELLSLPRWLEIAGFIIVGFVAVYGLFDARARSRSQTLNEQEDRVIKLYETEVERLRERIEELANQVSGLERQILTARTENATLTKILQGRDEDSVEYRKMGIESMKRGEVMMEILKSGESRSIEILEAIKNLYKIMNVHLENETQILADGRG